MASVVHENLHHLTILSLEEDYEHWFQLARALDSHFACIVAWIPSSNRDAGGSSLLLYFSQA